jgi:hypothetical protein
VHRAPPLSSDKEDQPLPLRATGIVLGLWIAALLVLAFFVVPSLFAACIPADVPLPSATP